MQTNGRIPTRKIILTYGIISGVVIISMMILGFYLFADSEGNKNFSEWLGYLTMLLALSVIFVGIKRYRDQELGGTIRFKTAFLLGLGISLVAGAAYVVSWEIHLAMTDYAFIDEYAAAQIADARSGGSSDAEIAQLTEYMDEMKVNYGKLLFRLPMTFLEIFPVGLLITLVSAAILRKPEILPDSA